MSNVLVAFVILENDEKHSVDFQELGVHLVFDVKMDMTGKTGLVADGHKTADPEGSTNAGIVSSKSIRIAFTYTALKMDLI